MIVPKQIISILNVLRVSCRQMESSSITTINSIPRIQINRMILDCGPLSATRRRLSLSERVGIGTFLSTRSLLGWPISNRVCTRVPTSSERSRDLKHGGQYRVVREPCSKDTCPIPERSSGNACALWERRSNRCTGISRILDGEALQTIHLSS